MKRITLLLVLGYLFSACQEIPAAHKNEIKKVDALMVIGDSLHQVVFAIDSNRVMEEAKRVDSIYELLTGPALNIPKNDKEFWVRKLGPIENIRHHFGRYLRDYPKLHKNLVYSQSQLSSLRNSLVDEQLDSNQVQEYLQVEEEAMRQVLLLSRKRVGPTEEALHLWDSVEVMYLQLLSKNDSLLP